MTQRQLTAELQKTAELRADPWTATRCLFSPPPPPEPEQLLARVEEKKDKLHVSRYEEWVQQLLRGDDFPSYTLTTRTAKSIDAWAADYLAARRDRRITEWEFYESLGCTQADWDVASRVDLLRIERGYFFYHEVTPLEIHQYREQPDSPPRWTSWYFDEQGQPFFSDGRTPESEFRRV